MSLAVKYEVTHFIDDVRDRQSRQDKRKISAGQAPKGDKPFKGKPFRYQGRFKPRSDPKRAEGRTCFHCKTPGHIKTNCPIWKKELEKQGNGQPLLRQATRWGSTYKIIDRYFDLRDALDTDDDDIVSLMPTRRQENRLRALLDQLRDFQLATMKLQEEGVTLLDVHGIFDAPVEKHPVVDKCYNRQGPCL
ncbi:uncharacterized protein IUM83_16560 [Phytophthora cinnamomi]|uniref:uncharacterized protein n=1 Tax=Phytophthora cinnamomi TaxID=4785 RepID=UPI00355A2EE6|nr:hypothetical protein IUM83_16560 [Phytophthora cinnamomi]